MAWSCSRSSIARFIRNMGSDPSPNRFDIAANLETRGLTPEPGGRSDPRGVPSNRRLGLGVEEVQALGVDGEAQAVLHLGARGRVDGSHHGVVADAHVEQDLRA